MVLVRDIVKFIQNIAPEALAEHDDPVGLHVGSMASEVNRVMVALDASRGVVKQAINGKAQMLVTHHPLIYRPLQRLTPDTPVSARVIDLVKNDVTLYCAHTNLDRTVGGTNDTLANLLSLNNIEQIIEVSNINLHKIAVFVPGNCADKVAEVMGSAGAGQIGLYANCSFRTQGTGYFTPLEGSNPHIGQTGILESVDEIRIEMVCPEDLISNVLTAMIEAHPYEAPAYDIYKLENRLPNLGLGRIGNLEHTQSLDDFVKHVEIVLQVKGIRVYGECPNGINRVAMCSGGGSGFYQEAKKHGADVFVTGDVKHHDATDAQSCNIAIIDAGHFETEKPGVQALANNIEQAFAGSGVEVEYVE